jgi:hypothetical protein
MSDTIPTFPISQSDKQKAHDILNAIRTLQQIEAEQRPATQAERDILQKFPGFGAVAKRIFPNPITEAYDDPSFEPLGEELKSLLTPEEYASARRTTYTAFYTSPVVMNAMHNALERLGLPQDTLVLEPGCGNAGFMTCAPKGQRFIGVEMDGLSGRIAKALYPEHDIRIENFRDSNILPVDAVIGNVPFADVRLEYKARKYPLHDFFILNPWTL